MIAAHSARLAPPLGAATAAVTVGWLCTVLSPPSTRWALVLTATAIAFTPMAISVLAGRFDPFEPVHLFAVTFGVLFAARPAFDLFRGDFEFVGYDTGATYNRALLAGVLGGGAFLLGYYSSIWQNVASRIPLPRAPLAPRTVNTLVVLFAGAALSLFGLFLGARGGLGAIPATFWGRTPDRTAAFQTSSGYFYAAPFALLSLGVLLLALERSWRSRRALGGFALVLASQPLAIAGGDRSWIIPAMASVVAVYYLRRGARPTIRTIVLTLALVFIFGISVPRDYRTSAPTGGTLGSSVTRVLTNDKGVLTEFLSGEDTAVIKTLALEMQVVPERIAFQHGRTFATALSRPVPRAVWPEKPEEVERVLMRELWPSLARYGVLYTYSFFGEPYLNFGFIGVVVVSFLFGGGWRILYSWFQRAPGNEIVIALFAVNWPFMLIYMRGGLGADYQRQVIAVAPLLAVVLLARRRTHRGYERAT